MSTIEIVGESLGIDAEKDLYTYFRRHYGEWFPAVRRVHRAPLSPPGSQPLAMERKLWRKLLGRVGSDPEVSLIDSFPLPVCRFARAYRCRVLAEESAFGYDEMSQQTFSTGFALTWTWLGRES